MSKKRIRLSAFALAVILGAGTITFPVNATNEYKDGKYVGTGDGYNGNIQLEVSIEQNKITSITEVSQTETKSFWKKAKVLLNTIVEEQSVEVDLIPRFYDVEKGHIRIGGADVRDINSADLMDAVSFVFQDNFLFKQSIMDNIRMGRPDATEDEVIGAAKAAQCDAFIENLPDGYQTIYGKAGVKLSGGQIQRIAIARAILKNSPILVLDEATAFSDPENEHLIQQALSKLMEKKTVIMIAHRLSTIRNADKILVMDDGMLVQNGNHETLIGQEGKYKSLWKNYTQTLNWKIEKQQMTETVEGGVQL